jgi:hypothetical protein
MTPEQLEIIIATNKRIVSARLVLAEAEAFKELIFDYFSTVKIDIVEGQTKVQAFISLNREYDSHEHS